MKFQTPLKSAATNRTKFWKRCLLGIRDPLPINVLFFLAGVFSMSFLALTVGAQYSSPAHASTFEPSARKIGASVPFIGCRGTGQAGPTSAPNGKRVFLPITAEAAHQLAYYKAAEGAGVLAPRGWFCSCVYGSNGYVLYVSPQQIITAQLYSTTWNGFTGPVIEIAGESGDTSGRFGVARAIARVFPAHRAFVEKVIKEGMEPASSFPFGPYPKDKLVYRSNEIVEYETPANTDGLGTNPKLKKNANSINGVAILTGQTPDLLLLSVRLSPNQDDLKSTIIQQVEREAMHAN